MDYKRLLARKRTSIPATIEAEGVAQAGAIRDLSMHGAFVVSQKRPAVGTKVRIRSEYMMIDAPFQIEAEVVTNRPRRRRRQFPMRNGSTKAMAQLFVPLTVSRFFFHHAVKRTAHNSILIRAGNMPANSASIVSAIRRPLSSNGEAGYARQAFSLPSLRPLLHQSARRH